MERIYKLFPDFGGFYGSPVVDSVRDGIHPLGYVRLHNAVNIRMGELINVPTKIVEEENRFYIVAAVPEHPELRLVWGTYGYWVLEDTPADPTTAE